MNREDFAFGKKNYMFMIIGLVVLAIGLMIMTLDGEEFGEGFVGITLGPLVVLAGFGIQFYAIFTDDEKKKSNIDLSESEKETVTKEEVL